MKRKAAIIILVLILSALFLVLLPIYSLNVQSSIGASGWGTPNDPINAHPGYKDVPFFVIVSAPVTLEPEEATLYLPSGILSSSCEVEAQGSFTQSSLGSYVITFDLTVLSSTSPGYYTGYLNLVFDNLTNGKTIQETGEVTIPVKPVIYPTVQLVWGTSSSPILPRAGEGITPLTLVVENPSEHPILNVKVNVTLPHGVLSLTGKQYQCFQVSAIPEGEVVPITEPVNVTPFSEGQHQVKYTVSFTNYLEFEYSTSGSLNTTIYPLSPLSISVEGNESDKNVTAGSLNDLYINLKSNTTGVLLSLIPSLKTVYTNFTQVSLTPGESLTFEYQVYVPETLTGYFPVIFKATLESMGQVENFTFFKSIYVVNNATPSIVDSFWGEPNQTTLAFPQEGVTPLTLVVENPLPVPISNVNITLIPPSGITDIYPYITLPGLGNFSVHELAYPVQIGNVSPGLHIFKYLLSYDGKTVNGNFTAVISQFSPVFAKPIISPIPAGGYSNLTVTIVNNGSVPAQDVSAFLEVRGLEETAFFNQTLLYLQPHSNSTFVFYLYAPPNLTSGVYPALLKVFFSEYSKLINETYIVPLVVVNDPSSLDVQLTPTIIYYSSNNTVLLKVTNPLPSPVYDVDVSMLAKSPLYISSPQVSVAEIPSNTTTTFVEYMIPEIPSTSTIPLEVTTSFLYKGLPYNQVSDIQLFSTGNVSISVNDVSGSVVNGSVVITGAIVNNGNSPAKGVMVNVDNYTSVYVGDLSPDTPTPFSVSFTVPSGYYHFNVTVSYLNSVNDEESVTTSLSMGVSYPTTTSHDSSVKPLGLIMGAGIVIIISLIIFLTLRGRKHEGQ